LPKKFEVQVNNSWCKGCSLCIHICPKKVLELDEVRGKSVPARQDDCIGCRQCENICPDMAITVKEKEEEKDA
jgi:Indolepyruvate ferredoxin oxidoreductase, alpha and beta subunits